MKDRQHSAAIAKVAALFERDGLSRDGAWNLAAMMIARARFAIRDTTDPKALLPQLG